MFLRLFLLLLVCGVLFGLVFQNDLRRPKVRHANIPDYVPTAINAYDEAVSSHHVKTMSFGPKNWSNEKDFGQKNDWDKETKGDFIVYYQKDKDGLWQNRALGLIQDLDHIKQSFKLFPSKLNSHKFPFYLAPSDSFYFNVVSHLANDSIRDIVESNDIEGFMVSEFGPLGYMARGCIIKASSFDVPFDAPNGTHAATASCLSNYVMWSYFDKALSLIETAEAISPEAALLLESAGTIGQLLYEEAKKSNSVDTTTAASDSSGIQIPSSEEIVQEDAPNEEPADSEEE